jgi:diguanylate cyclase (GGDEF)-like protein/PAS domain S-box-containing protein
MDSYFKNRRPFAVVISGIRRSLPGYGFAFLVVAAATALRYWLGIYFHFTAAILLYSPAVVLVCFTLGFVATLLSAAAIDFFSAAPYSSFAIAQTGDRIALALFVALGIVLSMVAETMRRRTTELVQAKEHLAEAQSIAQIGSWRLDYATDQLTWSDETYRIFRIPLGTRVSQKMICETAHIDPDDRQSAWDAWRAALQGGVYSSEHRIEIDGETRWIRVKARVESNSQREPLFASGTVQDITQEKRSKEANLYLASIIATTSDAIVGKTLDGIVTSWNQGAEDLYGYSAEEMIGEPIDKVVPPEHLGQLHEEMKSIRRGDLVSLYETERVRKDGVRIHVSLAVSPIKDAAGAIVGVSTIARDITERKRAEEAARRAALYTRSLIEASLDPLMIISRDGTITDVNQATERATGLSREQLIGSGFCAYFTEPEKARQAYQEVFAQGSVRDYPLAIRHVSGSVRQVIYNATVFCDEAGNYEGVFAAARDVTELKSAEENLRSVVAAMAEGLVVQQSDGRIISCNRSAEHILGVPAGKLLDQTSTDWQSFCFHEDGSVFLAEEHPSVIALRTGKSVSHVRMGIRRPDGGLNWILINAEPMFREGETTPHAAVITFSDDTQRLLAEERVRKAAQYTRSLIEVSLDPLVAISPDGKITDVNLATETVTGCPRASLIGSDFCDYFTSPEEARKGYLHAFENGAVRDFPLAIRHTSGRITDVLYNASVFKNQAGEVEGVFAAARDITERKRAEMAIAELAFYDPLTMLPNRRLLMDRLNQVLAACGRTARYAALLFVDLDDFKNVNDSLGHDAGDQLLQQVGRRLVDCLRQQDTVARFGGDEFVVLVPELSDNLDDAVRQMAIVGEKILAMLELPYRLGERSYRCTGSIGVTLFNSDEQSCDEVLKRADIAMFRAKYEGKKTLRFFNLDMQAAVMERATLEDDLRSALKENAFEIHYQPQVNRHGELIGAEALLRWRHPTRGLKLPGAFLHLAEENGLVDSIGQWVLETVCKQLVVWSRIPTMDHLTLAINVSAHEFNHTQFVDNIFAMLDRHCIDPRRLVLELTENVALRLLPETLVKMNRLRARGVALALDGFGTGYSSLSYLKEMPLDLLKVDQKFVRDLLTNPINGCILETILALGRILNLKVIVEGVETEEEKRYLEEHGVQFFQGYLFGRPVPVKDLLVHGSVKRRIFPLRKIGG